MSAASSLVFLRRVLVLAALATLAACATPGGKGPSTADGGAPHYKVGSPYKVNGRWYKPEADPNYEAVGVASWYGDQFNGRRTANGEVFDKTRLSAAHTTLPMPSLVEVKNLENGRKITVRVNDRGPFVDDRLIDLSHAAARELGFENQGLARVKIRYVGPADLYAKAESPGSQERGRGKAAKPAPTPVPVTTVAAAAPSQPRNQPEAPSPASAAPAGEDDDHMARLIGEALSAPPAKPSEYWIAVGAFASLNALEAARFSLPSFGETRVVMAPGADGATAYELQIGPDFDADSAGARLAALREAGYLDARIVDGAL